MVYIKILLLMIVDSSAHNEKEYAASGLKFVKSCTPSAFQRVNLQEIQEKLDNSLAKPIHMIETIVVEEMEESKWDDGVRAIKFKPLQKLGKVITDRKRSGENSTNIQNLISKSENLNKEISKIQESYIQALNENEELKIFLQNQEKQTNEVKEEYNKIIKAINTGINELAKDNVIKKSDFTEENKEDTVIEIFNACKSAIEKKDSVISEQDCVIIENNNTITALTNQVNELQPILQQKEEYEKQLANFLKANSEITGIETDLNNQSFEDYIQSFKDMASNLSDEIHKLQETISQKEKEIQNLQLNRTVDTTNNELLQKIGKSISTLEDKLEIKDEIDDDPNDYKIRIMRASQEIDKIKGESEKTQTQLKIIKEKLAQTLQDKRDMRKRNKELVKSLSDAQQTLKKLGSKYNIENDPEYTKLMSIVSSVSEKIETHDEEEEIEIEDFIERSVLDLEQASQQTNEEIQNALDRDDVTTEEMKTLLKKVVEEKILIQNKLNQEIENRTRNEAPMTKVSMNLITRTDEYEYVSPDHRMDAFLISTKPMPKFDESKMDQITISKEISEILDDRDVPPEQLRRFLRQIAEENSLFENHMKMLKNSIEEKENVYDEDTIEALQSEDVSVVKRVLEAEKKKREMIENHMKALESLDIQFEQSVGEPIHMNLDLFIEQQQLHERIRYLESEVDAYKSRKDFTNEIEELEEMNERLKKEMKKLKQEKKKSLLSNLRQEEELLLSPEDLVSRSITLDIGDLAGEDETIENIETRLRKAKIKKLQNLQAKSKQELEESQAKIQSMLENNDTTPEELQQAITQLQTQMKSLKTRESQSQIELIQSVLDDPNYDHETLAHVYKVINGDDPSNMNDEEIIKSLKNKIIEIRESDQNETPEEINTENVEELKQALRTLSEQYFTQESSNLQSIENALNENLDLNDIEYLEIKIPPSIPKQIIVVNSLDADTNSIVSYHYDNNVKLAFTQNHVRINIDPKLKPIFAPDQDSLVFNDFNYDLKLTFSTDTQGIVIDPKFKPEIATDSDSIVFRDFNPEDKPALTQDTSSLISNDFSSNLRLNFSSSSPRINIDPENKPEVSPDVESCVSFDYDYDQKLEITKNTNESYDFVQVLKFAITTDIPDIDIDGGYSNLETQLVEMQMMNKRLLKKQLLQESESINYMKKAEIEAALLDETVTPEQLKQIMRRLSNDYALFDGSYDEIRSQLRKMSSEFDFAPENHDSSEMSIDDLEKRLIEAKQKKILVLEENARRDLEQNREHVLSVLSNEDATGEQLLFEIEYVYQQIDALNAREALGKIHLINAVLDDPYCDHSQLVKVLKAITGRNDDITESDEEIRALLAQELDSLKVVQNQPRPEIPDGSTVDELKKILRQASDIQYEKESDNLDEIKALTQSQDVDEIELDTAPSRIGACANVTRPPPLPIRRRSSSTRSRTSFSESEIREPEDADTILASLENSIIGNTDLSDNRSKDVRIAALIDALVKELASKNEELQQQGEQGDVNIQNVIDTFENVISHLKQAQEKQVGSEDFNDLLKAAQTELETSSIELNSPSILLSKISRSYTQLYCKLAELFGKETIECFNITESASVNHIDSTFIKLLMHIKLQVQRLNDKAIHYKKHASLAEDSNAKLKNELKVKQEELDQTINTFKRAKKYYHDKAAKEKKAVFQVFNQEIPEFVTAGFYQKAATAKLAEVFLKKLSEKILTKILFPKMKEIDRRLQKLNEEYKMRMRSIVESFQSAAQTPDKKAMASAKRMTRSLTYVLQYVFPKTSKLNPTSSSTEIKTRLETIKKVMLSCFVMIPDAALPASDQSFYTLAVALKRFLTADFQDENAEPIGRLTIAEERIAELEEELDVSATFSSIVQALGDKPDDNLDKVAFEQYLYYIKQKIENA